MNTSVKSLNHNLLSLAYCDTKGSVEDSVQHPGKIFDGGQRRQPIWPLASMTVKLRRKQKSLFSNIGSCSGFSRVETVLAGVLGSCHWALVLPLKGEVISTCTHGRSISL